MEAKDSSNPYVAVVGRKYRNLKKKLEKITKVEQQLSSGKHLDDEQLVLLSSKQSVEKSIADIGALKTQLEELAKQLEEEQESIHKNKVEEPTSTVAVVESEEAFTETEKVVVPVTLTSSTQYEDLFPTPPPPENKPKDVIDPKKINEIIETKLRKVLKVFHVCFRYREMTGKPLPEAVDFFCKTLLGQTSISRFNDTLNSSLKSAELYVNDSAAHFEIIRGLKFHQMSEIIDILAMELESINFSVVPSFQYNPLVMPMHMDNQIYEPILPPVPMPISHNQNENYSTHHFNIEEERQVEFIESTEEQHPVPSSDPNRKRVPRGPRNNNNNNNNRRKGPPAALDETVLLPSEQIREQEHVSAPIVSAPVPVPVPVPVPIVSAPVPVSVPVVPVPQVAVEQSVIAPPSSVEDSDRRDTARRPRNERTRRSRPPRQDFPDKKVHQPSAVVEEVKVTVPVPVPVPVIVPPPQSKIVYHTQDPTKKEVDNHKQIPISKVQEEPPVVPLKESIDSNDQFVKKVSKSNTRRERTERTKSSESSPRPQSVKQEVPVSVVRPQTSNPVEVPEVDTKKKLKDDDIDRVIEKQNRKIRERRLQKQKEESKVTNDEVPIPPQKPVSTETLKYSAVAKVAVNGNNNTAGEQIAPKASVKPKDNVRSVPPPRETTGNRVSGPIRQASGTSSAEKSVEPAAKVEVGNKAPGPVSRAPRPVSRASGPPVTSNGVQKAPVPGPIRQSLAPNPNNNNSNNNNTSQTIRPPSKPIPNTIRK